MKTTQEKISIAKIQIYQKSPFLATVVSLLPTHIDNSIPTACTNGKHILINEAFFNSLDREQQQFLLAHEVLHCIYHHMTRRDNRDPLKWNFAGDYLINQKLIQQGFKMIDGGLYDPKYDDNWTTERIYDDLSDDEVNNTSNPLSGDIQEPADQSQNQDQTNPISTTAQLEQSINEIVSKAILQLDMANQAGSVPNDIRRYLEQLRQPKINWRLVLRRFLFELDNADYSWNRPRKKLLSHGFYLPKLQARNIGNISFAVDTSGSISHGQLNDFIAEVAGVFNTVKPKSIQFMLFDYTLLHNETMSNIKQLLKTPFVGGGGTDINPVLQAFNQSDSKALFVITDGYFFKKPIQVKKAVYWIIHNNPTFTAPYGKVLCLD